MTKNRNITFGYKMENGAITLKAQEAEAVKIIFSQYLSGLSLKKIAEQTTIPYRENSAAWNKNMVKRILECEKYTGCNNYSQIISKSDFENVKVLIAAKNTYKPKPKPLPKVKMVEVFQYTPNLTVTRINNEIGRELEKRETDKHHIKSLILQCAAEKYNNCRAERSTEC